DRDSVWLLAGPNGSGKSAVFDGMTFALFGYHRGGQQHAHKLINRQCEGLLVEFDFLLDNQLYQVRRTLKKTARKGVQPTRQVRRWNPSGGARGDGQWEEVADTGNQTGFDQWGRDHLGLTYETFTSSVLLLQGRADNLLLSRPPERSAVLNRNVGLEQDEKRAARANQHRKEHDARTEALEHQLAGIPEVTEAELESADQAIAAARAALQQARVEVERLQRLEVQAERWEGLQAKLAAARKQ